MDISFFFSTFLAGVLSLLPIVNPFSTLPVFLALTAGQSPSMRRRTARRACMFTFFLLSGALVAGSLIMEFFGISIAAMRVAGGMVVAYIGFRTLFPDPGEHAPTADDTGTADVAFVPLALPSMSGPGSIAVVIGMSSDIATQSGWLVRVTGYGLMIGVIAVVTLICLLVLRSGNAISRFLGEAGIDSIRRLMAFLLVCIGVQFIATGIIDFLKQMP